jgi:hypothetical protein
MKSCTVPDVSLPLPATQDGPHQESEVEVAGHTEDLLRCSASPSHGANNVTHSDAELDEALDEVLADVDQLALVLLGRGEVGLELVNLSLESRNLFLRHLVWCRWRGKRDGGVVAASGAGRIRGLTRPMRSRGIRLAVIARSSPSYSRGMDRLQVGLGGVVSM